MKKGLLISVLLMVSAVALALPSYTGLRGLNRTVDSKPIGAGEFSVALFSFLGMSDDTRAAWIGGEAVDVTDTEYDGTWYITTAFGLGDKFEIAGRLSYVWNCLSRESIEGREDLSGGENENDDGFSEAGLYLKYGMNPGEGNLWLGFMPWVNLSIYDGGNSPFVINNNEYDGIWQAGQPMFEMRRPMIGTDFSAGADLLMSLDMKPVVWHTNVGYHYFKQNFQFTDHRYGTGDTVAVDMDVEDPVFHLATGIEYPMKGWTLFAEAEWRHFLDRDYEAGNEERYDDLLIIQPGVRFELGSGFACDVVGGFSVDNFDPKWNDLGHHAYQAGMEPTNDYRANFAPFPEGYYPAWGVGVNLMYSSDLVEDRYALMTGTVSSSFDGQPLGATVAFPGDEADAAICDPGTGFYAAEVPEGSLDVSITAPGYMERTATLQVVAGQDMVRDFTLDPAKNVTGTFTDMETGLPIIGTVTYSDAVSATSGPDGTYSIFVADGEWILSASANGYLPATETVSISGMQEMVVDFQLEPCAIEEGQVLSFDNIYFDVNSATIKRESYEVLDEIVEILGANPNAQVQIAGHTDSDGAESYNQTLSEQRAQSVFDYLVNSGIEARRLSTVGYGENQPVVPNTSAANKAMNRRIEFVVLSNR
ncbi:MAG: hypothetical protein AVO35_09545 [Candidatus Aegiribacteria sp. MLS_C]|nr:MAG: hypothetical protein AVO35_09545 [Candidatus Aegiribacteria sp. MLS_C]